MIIKRSPVRVPLSGGVTDLPASIDDIQHPSIREALRAANITATNLEITSMADIPAATGLGSSRSFTTALLKALRTTKKLLIRPDDLGEQTCIIEIDTLKEPVGKQDQYIAAYGWIAIGSGRGSAQATFPIRGSIGCMNARSAMGTQGQIDWRGGRRLLMFYTDENQGIRHAMRQEALAKCASGSILAAPGLSRRISAE